ncbi:hypothetical protein HY624_03965 [Candidatus Uhrbacteria bacterium]|nr:hypothetical protein [Candidatus Uhrbacteria bacterium]
MMLRIEHILQRWIPVVGISGVLFVVGLIVLAEGNADTSRQEVQKYRTQYEKSLAQWKTTQNAKDADVVMKNAAALLRQYTYYTDADSGGDIQQRIQFAESIQKKASELRKMYVQVQVDTMRRYVGEMKYLTSDGMEAALIRGDQAQIDTLQRAQLDLERYQQNMSTIARRIEDAHWTLGSNNQLDLETMQQQLGDFHDNMITHAPSFTKIFTEMRAPEVQGSLTDTISLTRIQELRRQYDIEQHEKKQADDRRRFEEERRKKEEGPVSSTDTGSGGGATTDSR